MHSFYIWSGWLADLHVMYLPWNLCEATIWNIHKGIFPNVSFPKKTNTRKNLVPMTLRLISSSFSSTFPSFASVSLQVSSKWVLALVRLFLLGACQHKVSHVNPAHKHAQTEQCWNTWDAWNQMAGANIKPACLRIQPRLQRQVLSSAWIWGTG